MTFSPGPASVIRGLKSALPLGTRGGSRVPELGTLGSVRGALSNKRLSLTGNKLFRCRRQRMCQQRNSFDVANHGQQHIARNARSKPYPRLNKGSEIGANGPNIVWPRLPGCAGTNDDQVSGAPFSKILFRLSTGSSGSIGSVRKERNEVRWTS